MKISLSFFTSSMALTLFCLFSTTVSAEKPIATCVDEQGDLTYTDYLCETSQPDSNPHLMTESAINPTIRARIPSVVRAEAIRNSQLKSVTAEAQNQCEQRFVHYFKRKHPGVNSIPEVAFTNIVDQYVKGPNVSISLSGNMEYDDNSYSIYSNIECTVQRFKKESDWLIGYRER